MKMMKRKGRRGVALLLVMMSLALMTVLSVEIIAASRVELNIGRNAKERLQAYYMAQSAARLNLLRLQLYKEVRNSYEKMIPSDMIDKIWSFPLPELPMAGMDGVDWPGKSSGNITTEGSKIPINLLDGITARGSNEDKVKMVRMQLDGLITGMLREEDFDKQYRGLKPTDLIDPLQDWIDPDNDRREGGDESREYERLDPPYHPRNDRIPTLGELHMIENWNDDLVRRIGPHLTVLNTEGKVNPNFMSMDRLKTLCPSLTQEDLNLIEKHRGERTFEDLRTFQNYIQNEPLIRGGKDCQFPPDLDSSNRETVFFVEGTGVVGSAKRTLRLGIRIPEFPPPPPDPTKPPDPSATKNPIPGKLKDPEVVIVEEVL